MKKADAFERSHMGKVAELPCACCGTTGVHVHHIREGQGMGERASHFLTIPLCPDCHTGPNGIHGNKSFMRIRKLDELDMLATTIEALCR
jgi:hypothetical protein